MTKLRVFISHSSKDVAQAGPPPVDAKEIARRERLRYATRVRDEIVGRLDPQRCEVLLDVLRLEPGDGWRAKLHLWLQTCDAALILLGEEAAGSEWVRKETTILVHRRALRESLLVIPVFLGEVDAALLRERGFEADVLEAQALRLADRGLTDANAIALAEGAAAKLNGLAPVKTDEPLSKWVDAIVVGLRHADGAFLERARKKVKVADEDWSDNQQRLAILAHHLLRSPLRWVVDALIELSAGYSQWEPFQTLTTWLLPVWVDEMAATRLLGALGVDSPQPPRILAINGTETSTGVDYVRRAWCCPPWIARIAAFDTPVGEAQGDELSERIREVILGTLGIKDRKDLLKQRLNNTPFIVILGTNVPVLREQLAQMAHEYAPVKFIVMAGQQFERLGADSDVFIRLRPEIAAGAEDEAFVQKLEIDDLRWAGSMRSP